MVGTDSLFTALAGAMVFAFAVRGYPGTAWRRLLFGGGCALVVAPFAAVFIELLRLARKASEAAEGPLDFRHLMICLVLGQLMIMLAEWRRARPACALHAEPGADKDT